MKPVLPTLKEKKRYIVFEVISPAEASQEEAYAAIQEAAKSFMGISTFAKSGLRLIGKWSRGLQRGIVRVNRRYLNHARASFCYVHRVGKSTAMLHSVVASGSLKKAAGYLSNT